MSRLITWIPNSSRFMWRLVSDPSVYWELNRKSWWQVACFFLGILGLVGGLGGWQTVHHWGPTLLKLPQAISDEWISHYPPELTVHWDPTAHLTLNPAPTQPVTIGWPAALAFTNWPGPLAIYNPQDSTNPVDLTKNLTQPPLVVFDQHSFWTSRSNGQWSQQVPLNQLPLFEGNQPQTWNKASFTELLGQGVKDLHRGITVSLWVWPFLSVVFHWLSRIWFVVTEGTVIWIASRLLGWKLSWPKLVKFICVVVPMADVVGLIAQLIYPNLTWSLFHPAFWILLIYLNLQSRKEMLKTS